MKTFIQVGLLSTAEYAYLTEDASNTPANDCLLFHSEDKWQYVGVEINPMACYKTAEKYTKKNRKFLCAGLGSKKEIRQVLVHRDSDTPIIMSIPVITINDLVRQLSIKSLDGIYIDIEGQEMEILRNYDWEFKPEFFGVEIHDFKEKGQALERNAEEAQSILIDQGYKKTFEKMTNADRTIEMQFTI